MNLVEFGRNMKPAPVRHHLRAAANGVDRHLIAAGDGKHRLQFRFEKAPVAGFGAGMQVMMRHVGLSCRRCRALFVIAGHSSLPCADYVNLPAPGNPSLFEQSFCEDRWIRGSSPRMTSSVNSEASLVFCPVQDARLPAVA